MSTSEGVQFGIGFLGVALAFGLTAVTMSHAVGRVSGIPVTSTSVNPAGRSGRRSSRAAEVPSPSEKEVAADLRRSGALTEEDGTSTASTDPIHDEVECAGDAADPDESAIVAP